LERKTHIDVFGASILIIFMVMLGLNQVAVKVVNEGMAPLFQAGLRSLCAAPVLFLYCLYRKYKIDLSWPVLLPGILCGIFFAVEFALLFKALEYTTVARASVFFYTMPFWVALGAHFLIPDEKLTPIRIAGLLLAILGVAIALANKNTTAGPNAFLGDLMSILAGSLWAAIALVARTTKFSSIKPDVQILYQLVVSAMILMPITLFGETFREPTAWHFMIFAAQVLILVCIGFVVWFWVLSIYPASDMASFTFLAPLFGVLFGWLLLDEALTWSILIALTFVGAGIVLVNRR